MTEYETRGSMWELLQAKDSNTFLKEKRKILFCLSHYKGQNLTRGPRCEAGNIMRSITNFVSKYLFDINLFQNAVHIPEELE
jgi:hypothetical protein